MFQRQSQRAGRRRRKSGSQVTLWSQTIAPPGLHAASPAEKTAVRPVGQKASIGHCATRPSAKPSTQQQVPSGRYGGFMTPPPPLDTTSPRTLSLVNVHTDEALTVTYWSDGTYRRDALDKLNHFLRDSREGAGMEMDPRLFDVL